MTRRMVTVGAGAAALYFALSGCGPSDTESRDGGGDGGSGGQIMGQSGGRAGGGSGGTGGSPGDPDACPGFHLAARRGEPLTIRGTTQGLADDVTPFCAAAEDTGADAVYEIAASDSGTLALRISPTTPGMRPILYVQRGKCGTVSATVACETARDLQTPTPDGGVSDAGAAGTGNGGRTGSADAAASGGRADTAAPSRDAAVLEASVVALDAGARDASGSPADAGARRDAGRPLEPPLPIAARASLAVARGESIYVVIDSTGGPGNFVLEASLTAPVCGDGVVNPDTVPPEQCDYGPSQPRGCAQGTCRFEPPDPDDTCAIGATALSDAAPLTVTGHTIGYTDNYAPPCEGVGAGGPDAVRAVLSDVAGTVTANASADFDVVLYASDSCVKKALGGALACSDGERKSASETISFPVEPSVPSFVVVDGFDARAFGTYSLTLTFVPSP